MLNPCADKSHNLLQYAPLLYHVVGGSEHICHFILLILELLPIRIDISSFLAPTFYSKVFLKCKKSIFLITTLTTAPLYPKLKQ